MIEVSDQGHEWHELTGIVDFKYEPGCGLFHVDARYSESPAAEIIFNATHIKSIFWIRVDNGGKGFCRPCFPTVVNFDDVGCLSIIVQLDNYDPYNLASAKIERYDPLRYGNKTSLEGSCDEGRAQSHERRRLLPNEECPFTGR